MVLVTRVLFVNEMDSSDMFHFLFWRWISALKEKKNKKKNWKGPGLENHFITTDDTIAAVWACLCVCLHHPANLKPELAAIKSLTTGLSHPAACCCFCRLRGMCKLIDSSLLLCAGNNKHRNKCLNCRKRERERERGAPPPKKGMKNNKHQQITALRFPLKTLFYSFICVKCLCVSGSGQPEEKRGGWGGKQEGVLWVNLVLFCWWSCRSCTSPRGTCSFELGVIFLFFFFSFSRGDTNAQRKHW